MVAFLYAVYTPFGEEVVDMHKNPIRNPQNKQVLGMGAWNDPDILDQLRSATTHVLVNAHGHAITYWNACQNCSDEVSKKNFSGCRFHSPPRLVCQVVDTLSTVNMWCVYVKNDNTGYMHGCIA